MRLVEYLTDPEGVKSSGRLIAAYLVVVGVLSFPAGLVLPSAAEYTSKFTNQCFGYASIFYGATKGYDVFNWASSKLRGVLGKDAQPAPETKTEPKGVSE